MIAKHAHELPQTSVISAVWHGDPARHALLQAHSENLARQSVPVAPIYVFDGGDRPPASFVGRFVCAREPLTIYQAWNIALSMVQTPLVMNLNLDDRLAPDAVETLETALHKEDATLVGGDWNICYSQANTDAVEPCYPAARLPYVREWPPKKGTLTRLGSGTGEFGALGPATLWRMEAHIGAPRYPWRLLDGTLIRTIGDRAWWEFLHNRLHRKIVRMPVVIGNYHCHPNEQAEFRYPGEDEANLMNRIGVSLL